MRDGHHPKTTTFRSLLMSTALCLSFVVAAWPARVDAQQVNCSTSSNGHVRVTFESAVIANGMTGYATIQIPAGSIGINGSAQGLNSAAQNGVIFATLPQQESIDRSSNGLTWHFAVINGWQVTRTYGFHVTWCWP